VTFGGRRDIEGDYRLSRFLARDGCGILASMHLDDCRRFYSEEIQFGGNITSKALVEVFARVPRENFLGPGPWKIASTDLGLGGTAYRETEDADPRRLYHNVPVALDPARDLNNGQPAALASWIQALDIKKGHRVYHLGCGVGYYTAVMAEMAGPSGHVLASEVDVLLAARATRNLAGYSSVSVHSGDGVSVDPGPCDAIFINAGVTLPHPKWLESLNEGGNLVVPFTVGMGMGMGKHLGRGFVAKITREPNGFSARATSFVAIYSCSSLRDPGLEQALGKAMATGALLKMRSLRRDGHEQTDTCLLHGGELCLSKAEVGSFAGA
jgi:protein-L-isoaspartate(D-aspartate) O-methyltransferase